MSSGVISHPYILEMKIYGNIQAEQCGSYNAVKTIDIYKNDLSKTQIGVNGIVFQLIEKKSVGVTPENEYIRGKDAFAKITKSKYTEPEYKYIELFLIKNGKMVDENDNIIDDAYGSGALVKHKGSFPILDASNERMTARVVQCGDAVFISDNVLPSIQSIVDLFQVHSKTHASNGLRYVENTQTQPDLINQTWSSLTSASESGPPVCDIIQSEFSDTRLSKKHGRMDYACNLSKSDQQMERSGTVGNNTDPADVSKRIKKNLEKIQSTNQSNISAHFTSVNPNGNNNVKGTFFKNEGGKSKRRRRTNRKRKTKRRRRRTYKNKK